MKIFEHYLRNAASLLQLYKGEVPFAVWIKGYFKEHKEYGSRDRKMVADLCYCYFRLGNAFKQIPVRDRILAGVFLCKNDTNDLVRYFKPGWEAKQLQAFEEKMLLLQQEGFCKSWNEEQWMIYPYTNELSSDINALLFVKSHLHQPGMFLRVRAGNDKIVEDKLRENNIVFNRVEDHCLSLPASSKVESVINLNKEAVVQDWSSQQVARFYKLVLEQCAEGSSLKVWDCCAASGGKSIMLYDLYPGIRLTVSDIRKSILINLEERFAKAGIKQYRSFIADLTSDKLHIPKDKYDVIVCDVPCSGSGTWGRTPEQLSYFRKEKISYYTSLQKSIVTNIVPYLKEGGFLLYTTCSIFKNENEDMVEYINKELQLDIVSRQLIKGYENNADSMFGALFRKK